MIYMHAKYQKPSLYIKRDMSTLKFSNVANHARPKSVNREIIGQVGRGPCDLCVCQISKAYPLY